MYPLKTKKATNTLYDGTRCRCPLRLISQAYILSAPSDASIITGTYYRTFKTLSSLFVYSYIFFFRLTYLYRI